jgi:hypothetical protein
MPKETSLIFQPSSVLLDKGVVRRIYEFQVRVAKGIAPTPAQIEAVKILVRLCARASRLYITQQTSNILALRPPEYAQAILSNTEVLQKGRYLRRWARRLRRLAFAREDAIVLAYGSFGIVPNAPVAGIEVIVTNDFKLAANFTAQQAQIQKRFERMIFSLPAPYASLKLPVVMTTTALRRVI